MKKREKVSTTVIFLIVMFSFVQCKKSSTSAPPPTPPPAPSGFEVIKKTIDAASFTSNQTLYGISTKPVFQVSFSDRIDKSTVSTAISYRSKSQSSSNFTFTVSYQNNDSTLTISTANDLNYLNEYVFSISTLLKSVSGKNMSGRIDLNFITRIDSSDKFAQLSDSELLDRVQRQTFSYFWEFAHPSSGLARERSNGDNNTVTSGGSGFGIMAIITAVHRNFITRAQGLARMQTIVGFLKNTAQKHKGAFPHWLNGQTGATIPFSQKDNGADLVETSYLIQGLLCARQYFDDAGAAETILRNDINAIWQEVQWDFFRKNNENVLYWHWSPTYNWDMNMPIKGWNECLITYVLAASSPTHAIPKIVYDAGWAQNGAIKNCGNFFGYTLPLGPDYGGPLFFSHYSFLGIDPNGLSDPYANYEMQVTNHTKINYEYCKTNPKNYYGYSDRCWGLTASDIPNGYTASSPTNDVGVIAPTAALSSFPYTPTESMKALKFFYYTLGDKLWTDYGFRDAFSLKDIWFSNSHLAIDQGPIIVMIENYRSGLLWKLFMSCPEVKTGMKALGFQSPHL
ncbi:MAG TPA: glucoamylase family protein [Flavisolibacter sp.]|nr:glucoamylase family protein [Flavisolibacter sp.]